jgi:hypothetical protein
MTSVELKILKEWSCKAFTFEPGDVIFAHWEFAEQLIAEGVAVNVTKST